MFIGVTFDILYITYMVIVFLARVSIFGGEPARDGNIEEYKVSPVLRAGEFGAISADVIGVAFRGLNGVETDRANLHRLDYRI